jgi:lipopolysaccharide transport system ATP-binding protein
MSDVAIRVQGLGKRYKLGAPERYRTLRDTVADVFTAPSRWFGRGRSGNPSEESFWALKDISFEVKQGDVVGIIGRNGAGKSTLLKVLSRITEPTAGQADIHGRIASLLEVGTGFHPELTGRENIYLNGAILGMKKAEIQRKFDEIVAFAEVEKFLDTAVKYYSSGMYVRLAFAVAAHLEPEILVVDEVLAVGDAAFQKKCLRRMEEVASEGRTVLFVSHNMTAIQSLCAHAILLRGGRVESDGPTHETILRYLNTDDGGHTSSVELCNHPNRLGRNAVRAARMTAVTLESEEEPLSGELHMGGPLTIRVDFESPDRPLKPPVLGVVIKTSLGIPLLGVNNIVLPAPELAAGLQRGSVVCHFDSIPLMPGRYLLDLYLSDTYAQVMDMIPEAISFQVCAADVFGTGQIPPSMAGPICWPAVFRILEPEEKESYAPAIE